MTKILMVLLTIMVGGSTRLSAQTKSKQAPVAKTKAVSAAVLANGKKVYTKYCLACHMADGGGVQNMNPPLIKTSYVLGNATKLIKVILNGMSEGVEIDGETYTNIMPPHGFLTDQEVADVLTYVRSSFGNKAPAIKVAEVKAARTTKK